MPDGTLEVLTIQSLERLNLSANANPRFRVTFTNGLVAQTQTDAAVGYSIDNPEYRGVPVLVDFTRAGRIRSVEVSRAKPLNSVMEFDHVIRVREDGSVDSGRTGFHAPEINLECDKYGQVSREDEAEMTRHVRRQGWTLLTGWTRQYRVGDSPIMHASEFVGGDLEKHILGNPGLYVVTDATMLGDGGSAGWLIAYREK